MDDLISRLEKTAGIGSYLKNVTGIGVKQAEKAFKGVNIADKDLHNQLPQLRKNLDQAKLDRNIARTGTAAVGIAGGAGLGGYAAYQKSKEPVVDDLMQQNQLSQNNQFNQLASENDLLTRLEKTAAVAYVPVEVPDEQVAQAQAQAQGQDPAQAQVQAQAQPQTQDIPASPQDGVTQADVDQEGPYNDDAYQDAAVAAAQAAASDQGPMMEGNAPVSPESAELNQILAQHQQDQGLPGKEVAQENPRQGAGSVSNAPAGEDKTASELISRLEKTAESMADVPDGDPNKSQVKGDYWHKLSPAEVAEEDETQSNVEQKALFERLQKTAGENGDGKESWWAKNHRPESDQPGRQGRTWASENFWGAGPYAYEAKRDNKWGVTPEDNHATANAKALTRAGALLGGIPGALSGGMQGALLGGKGMIIPGALAGGTLGGLFGAGIGHIEGKVVGHMQDHWDKKHPIEVVEEEEQTASHDELLNRLVKTASDEEQKKHHNPAAVGATVGGSLGAALGSRQGIENETQLANGVNQARYERSEAAKRMNRAVETFGPVNQHNFIRDAENFEAVKPNLLRGAVHGGIAAGAPLALMGAGIGALVGHTKHHQEQTASEEELLNRLEKTAGIPGVGVLKAGLGKATNAVKTYAGNVSGKTYGEAKKTLDTWNTPDALKANAPKVGVSNFRNKLESLDNAANKAKADMDKARKVTAIAGGGAVAGAGVSGAIANHDDKMENTASEEDVMNGLFKEAAAMIINEELPAVKQHIDIMDRIKF